MVLINYRFSLSSNTKYRTFYFLYQAGSDIKDRFVENESFDYYSTILITISNKTM